MEKITNFKSLEVYQESYRAAIEVVTKLLPQLPISEKFDLKDQLSRSSKAVPRLIAEGYAKKHQHAGFQKYLDDAMAEANETMVGIEQARDIYQVDKNLCDQLADTYDKVARKLYKLALAWDNFKEKGRKTKP